MSLTFNMLLESAGIDVSRVRLMYHSGGERTVEKIAPYDMWRQDREVFEEFQSIQRKRSRCHPGEIIAGFVVSPIGQTLFVGLYEILSRTPLERKHLKHFSNIWDAYVQDMKDHEHFFHVQRRMAELSDFEGRLVIDWGPGTRAWKQHAKNKDKGIIEIRRQFQEERFPGFMEFGQDIPEFGAIIPHGWQEVLRAVNGVYLLTCNTCGMRYVGSAYGENGIWGRMEEYAVTGHGGNQDMKAHTHKDYHMSILEVLDPSTDPRTVIQRENFWKEKLRTRDFGLNLN